MTRHRIAVFVQRLIEYKICLFVSMSPYPVNLTILVERVMCSKHDNKHTSWHIETLGWFGCLVVTLLVADADKIRSWGLV